MYSTRTYNVCEVPGQAESPSMKCAREISEAALEKYLAEDLEARRLAAKAAKAAKAEVPKWLRKMMQG